MELDEKIASSDLVNLLQILEEDSLPDHSETHLCGYDQGDD